MKLSNNDSEQALIDALEHLRREVGDLRLHALGLTANQVIIEKTWGTTNLESKLPPDWMLGCGDHAQSMRHGKWCPFCPKTHHTNQLAPLDRDLAKYSDTTTHHAFLSDHDQILGHLITQRAPTAVKPRALLMRLRRALVAWHARESRHEEIAHVLLTASGRRISWSADARQLLEARWEDVEPKIRDHIDDPSLSPLLVNGYVARWSKMTHDARTAIILSFSRPGPLEIDWSHALGSQQVTIAQLAVKGLDNPTIAQQLGVSRNTIKYHLKQIYEHLDINSRAELAELFARDASGCHEA